MTALYIVSTPIGNLSDISFRATEILKSVDWIAAEDTRHSQRLLSHYEIHTPCFSLHEHNEDERIEKIISLLRNEKSVALISDAGTPLISDPGFRLVRAVRDANFKIIPIPGACAAIAALVASGLPTDRFIFEGFLPAKNAALESHLEKLKSETRTIVFYESVHRITKTLPVMKKIFGSERVATVARELTKSFETIKQDTLENLCIDIIKNTEAQKGEFVIIVQGALSNTSTSDQQQLTTLLTQLLTELSVKQAVSLACKITQLNRKVVYALALDLKKHIDNPV
ncbi:MAG TPA: 16S rRNA (cytidine(1402)-2'-O)-methyltransferase [Coxiellaceae bacterium]|nr:MAG: 16S rRNA (cytidine(1402)-2'-O)-methyltransferase [Gammaproteobacteria bacterium RIFCSPHIGHO2_12_FULL_36_30]HLB56116.1 16S rRNA (cytidine(1402)-2'-O)-methyltransferase [Coxiellaceae bacterium]